MKGRAGKVLDPATFTRVLAALDSFAKREGVVGYRTRAFAYLMADGALRSGTAVWLDMEAVVRDPKDERIEVLREVTMRACEGTKYRPRTFQMGEAARMAIADYLKAIRKSGWLTDPKKLKGPLFVSRYPGKQQRLSQRTAIQAWHSFLEATPDLDQELQLDDLVITGRTRFAAASGGSPELLSKHAGISSNAAVRYSDHLPSRPGSTADVLASLDSNISPQPARAVQAAPEPSPDIVDQIRRLAELRDAKVLTDKEFQAKKRELLARI
jgi:hypothetical protein